MSLAIILQQESNTLPGGSLQGYLTGSDSTSASDTFYGRRLTDLAVNQSGSGVTFTPSTGGSGAASTAGQITLVPGTYRIDISATYRLSVSGSVIWGLYNVTSGSFEVYEGGAVPIIGTVAACTSSTPTNIPGKLTASFTVTSTNKTYEIRHKCSNTTDGRSVSLCGTQTTMTGTNVNGAASLNPYCLIRILKTS